MSEEFSDELSDPTPSPSPAPSPSKPSNGRRATTTGATGAGRGKPSSSASTRPAAPTHRKSTSAISNSAAAAATATAGVGTHSRTHSLANSSHSTHVAQASSSRKNTKKKSNATSNNSHKRPHSTSPADEEEDGSELSPVPSEKEDQEDDEEEEDEDEDDNDGAFATSARLIRPGGRSTRQTSAASLRGRGGRSGLGRGVIPAPMWEWAKKKNYKKPKSSDEEEENSDDEDAERGSNPDVGAAPTAKTSRASASNEDGELAEPLEETLEDDEHAALDEDEPMENATKANSEEAEGNDKSGEEKDEEDDEDEKAIEKLTIPLVKVEPPPSAVLPSALLPDGQDDEPQDDDENAEEEGDGEDLQPADRQLALDALAILELKFALLRQRIYQDKMDELGKEEQMIHNGTHPEMLHTISELEKRRDKRIVLAEKRRKREMDLAVAVRKYDEDGIWSWWMVTKDEVQADLITETSRKRRRVERERRALLDPVRSSLLSFPPEPPRSSSLEPARPNMKTIVGVALRHPYARLPNLASVNPVNGTDAPKGSKYPSTNGVFTGPGSKNSQQAMPTLSQLGEPEIQEDLELLHAYKRGFTDPEAVLQGGAVGGLSGTVPVNVTAVPGTVPTANDYSRHIPSQQLAAGYETDPGREPQYNDHPGAYSGYTGHGTTKPGVNGSGHDSKKRHPQNYAHPSSAFNAPVGPHGRQPIDSASYPSPGLGLQNMQRPGESMTPGVSTGMPILPPAPSTVPSSSNTNKHHHHHHHHHHPTAGSGAGTGPVSSHSQHSNMPMEQVRRERDPSLSREKTYSSAANAVGMGIVAPNSSYVPQTSAGAAVSAGHMPPTARSHSHSVSHYHHQPPHGHSHSHSVGHTHANRSRPEGHGHSHTHTVQVHHHPHSHASSAGTGPAAIGSSHSHVIHNHAAMPPPPQTPPSQYREGTSNSSTHRGDSRHRTSTTSKRNINRPDEDGWRTSPYSDIVKVMTLKGSLHPSLSQSDFSGGHPASGRRRDSWSDREDPDGMRERERPRDREKDKAYSQSQSGASMMPISSLGSAAAGQYPTTIRDAHAPRYAYGSGPGYSPPSHPRRNSPPPSVHPAGGPTTTSQRYARSTTGPRQSPANDTDGPMSHSQGDVASHSPTSSLNAPGFNPWSAGPRSTASTGVTAPPPPPRAYPANVSPAITSASSTFGGSKITPPLPSASTVTSTSTILARPSSTSPVLPRPLTAPPRPSISPAPRPPSSSSIRAILQPPHRDIGVESPQPLAPLVGIGAKSERGEAMAMDVDQPSSGPPLYTLPPLSTNEGK